MNLLEKIYNETDSFALTLHFYHIRVFLKIKFQVIRLAPGYTMLVSDMGI